MFVQAFTVLLPFLSQAAASPYHRQSPLKTIIDCPSGVHIIGVRGTAEDPGLGAMGRIVEILLDRIPGSDAIAIDYPASGVKPGEDGKLPVYNFPEYIASKTEGLDKITAEIELYSENCPNTGLILMGYSQGAHVVGDALCGASGPVFPPRPPISTDYTGSLRAILQLGDPTNIRNLPWHAGNSTRWGLFPRQSFEPCRQYGDIWQSYCDAYDLFCDSGLSMPVHRGYVGRYLDDIVEFLVNKAQGSQYHGSKNGVSCNDL